jgi:hypothetical protein
MATEPTTDDRRAATLLAVAKHLETVANDDALDLFDGLAAPS